MNIPRWNAAAVGLTAALVLTPGTARAFPLEALESVVSVLPDWPDRPQGQSGGRPEEPEGSGVAVLPGGLLVTNAHVLGRANTIKVRFADGIVLPAEIVGRDPPTDLALIKVARDLPVPALNTAPRLGEKVCAVGNPFGLGLSVTCGVVSAVGRSGTGFNPIEDFVQTDAAINPGASGGALVDERGRLVGVLAAIFTKQGDANIGVNFASSVALVMRVAKDLRDHGRVRRARSGLVVAELTDDKRAHAVGARIQRLDPDGAAQAAGLKVGDVILAIDGRPIRKGSDVAAAFYLRAPGENAAIGYLRDGTRATATVRLPP